MNGVPPRAAHLHHEGGRRIRVGLLGGSFNPAHDGHRHISLLALRLLKLDRIWWLVSPQNPLKRVRGMAPFEDRLAAAQRAAHHPGIRVSGVERSLGTRYTADTLQALVRRFPRLRFVWIMGADNLIQIPHWRDWEQIFELVPVAVFDRPTYSLTALLGKAARRYRRARVPARSARKLAGLSPPAWVFIDRAHDPRSATAIRQRRRSRRPGTAEERTP